MRYDLHTHTLNSHCSNLKPDILLKIAIRRGLDGIAVTDHNTIKGGLAVRKLNRRKDFEVIVGSEVKTDEGEILGYYLNSEVKPGPVEEVIDRIHEQGGLAVVAHPFDPLRNHFKRIPEGLDAIETFNSRCSSPTFNWNARKAAASMGLPQVGGSDGHFSFEIGRAYTVFEGSLKEAIRSGKTRSEGTILFGPFGNFRTLLRKVGRSFREDYTR